MIVCMAEVAVGGFWTNFLVPYLNVKLVLKVLLKANNIFNGHQWISDIKVNNTFWVADQKVQLWSFHV